MRKRSLLQLAARVDAYVLGVVFPEQYLYEFLPERACATSDQYDLVLEDIFHAHIPCFYV
jgi:hypothetical protein